MESRSAKFVLPGLWKQIREMRNDVISMTEGLDSEVISGTAVAVTELVENAIKYGVPVPEMPDVLVHVDVSEDRITINVLNGSDGGPSVERLLRHIGRLEAAASPLALFLERLEELSESIDGFTGLGIYRVAAEGKFTLSARLKDSVVNVTATRFLASGD